MSAKEKWLWGYRVVRSILFTLILFIGALYLGLYVMLSLPGVQHKISSIASEELTEFLGGRVEIEDVEISPFNEVMVTGLDVYQPDDGALCLHADKVGAGVSVWNLLVNRRIVITYAELIGLKADVSQKEEGAPLNIQFIIDAFAPQDPSKPPAKFNLEVRNIVVRKCAATFNRQWQPKADDGKIDFNHLVVTGLNADVALPRLSNERIDIDLRRLAIKVNHKLDIQRLSLFAVIDKGDIRIKNFKLMLPNSRISLNDLELPLKRSGGNFKEMMRNTMFNIELNADHLIPAEFSGFYPPLAELQTPFELEVRGKGNTEAVTLSRITLKNKLEDLSLDIKDAELGKGEKGLSEISLSKLTLHAGGSALRASSSVLPPHVAPRIRNIISEARALDIDLEGNGSIEKRSGTVTATVESGYGNLDVDGRFSMPDNLMIVDAKVASDGLAAGRLLDNPRFGMLALNLDGKLAIDSRCARKGVATGLETIDKINMILPEGEVTLDIPKVEIDGELLTDINLQLSKSPKQTVVSLTSDDPDYDLQLDATVNPSGTATTGQLHADIGRIGPHLFIRSGKFAGYAFSSKIDADLAGNTIDNLQGSLVVTDFNMKPLTEGKSLTLNKLAVSGHRNAESSGRLYTLTSDWLAANVSGDFLPSKLPSVVKSLITDLNRTQSGEPTEGQSSLPVANLKYDLTLYGGGNWNDFFSLPVTLPYEARLSGQIDSGREYLSLNLNAPYIQQGRDKLIQHTRLDARIEKGKGTLDMFSSIPTKKGVLDLDAGIGMQSGVADITIGFNREKEGAFYGDMQLTVSKIQSSDQPDIIKGHIKPTKIWLNDAAWDIGDADISYAPKRVEINDFSIRHADQFVLINGVASAEAGDEVNIRLNDMDLDYIFDTLNIDYVSFGGLASGEAVGRSLLSGKPEAFTKKLFVKDLSYNHAVLGDGDLYGDFNATEKRVGIKADVAEKGRRVALIDGGIWLGRDSLSFGIEADKVKVGFLQTFMQAFSSHVDGRASGNALLYGTFKDIDLKGRLFADTISIKVDYTNVTYSGSDSVMIDPGNIRIPPFRLKDQYGNSAYLQGYLSHNCFHDPVFRFNINEARNLLVYDTDAGMNPIWYGRIFGSGGGEIVGHPGYVGIMADMTTRPGSTFTFVLSDEQEAMEYNFLTFTDHRKELEEEKKRMAEKDSLKPDDFAAAFHRQVAAQEAAAETALYMDLRATVNPSAKLTLVMDPIAGDKITAVGDGAMNITYSSESNDMKMYGKYTLQEGTYNFSLQDLILRDFIIKPGSNIAFNGDPMNGLLDIKAAYRVNTNITDLDKSFATDRDLNRTNVPVDATLIVTGEMTQPDISFDVEFPTLNDEVAQKVRSIISSEDMMTRQIIYLLALNRFYTPEYMGNTSSGGEWASVASSTLSSQLTNILGQLTDKVNIMPSLRSDKGDFSDLEVDLALSSRLFNNRLLVNGNFGYRDKSTSSTTFIGDFDIEYLLHRNGNFRLKAYNHFNDQNYYLKSALTTQGIGVIYRKDFDRLFRRKRKLTK